MQKTFSKHPFFETEFLSLPVFFLAKFMFKFMERTVFQTMA